MLHIKVEILNRRRTFRVSSQGKTAHGSHLRTIGTDADVEATGFEEITREIDRVNVTTTSCILLVYLVI